MFVLDRNILEIFMMEKLSFMPTCFCVISASIWLREVFYLKTKGFVYEQKTNRETVASIMAAPGAALERERVAICCLCGYSARNVQSSATAINS